MKEKNKILIRLIILIIVIFLFAAFFVSRCGFAIIPVTTKYAYKPILKFRWENRSLVEHFPSEIPEEAKNVKFYYRAGMMQGGTTIELRMQMPHKEFDAIIQQHRTVAMLILDHFGKPIETSPETKDSYELSLHFYTVSREEFGDEYHEGPLPSGYIIFLLHLKGNWNHGKEAGIAVNQTRREIIYWAESW